MMIHREYIEPLLKVVYIKSLPILAGSADDYIPEGNGEAAELVFCLHSVCFLCLFFDTNS